MKSSLLFFSILFLSISSITIAQNTLQWRSLPGAPTAIIQIQYVHFINPQTGWVCGGNGGELFRTTNGGFNWNNLTPQPPISFVNSICFFDSLNGFCGLLANSNPQSTPLFKTTNGGFNWIPVTSLPDTGSYGLSAFSLADDSTIYACGKYDKPAVVLKTTNRGLNWVSLDLNGMAEALVDCWFFNRDSGFVSGSIGDFFAQTIKPVVLFTSNGGNTWVVRHTGSRTFEWSYRIAFPTRNTGYVAIERDRQAADSSLIFLKTTNGGVSWEEKPYLPYYTDAEGIGFVNETTGWIGGGDFDSTYETTNGGLNWFKADWGIAINKIQFLSDTLGYAVGKTVYKYSRDSLIGITVISEKIPNVYSLKQNYPNPFNPKTIIQFDVSVYSNVGLIVYDILGKEISRLVNAKLNPGSYEVQWNALNYPSGVYFYRLTANDYTDSKKMILIK